MPKEIRKPGHNIRIQNVYFQIVLISHVEAIEGDSFDQSDPGDVSRFLIVNISVETDCECMINR
jgi:hypothetical protein